MVCHGMEDQTVCHVVDVSWDGGSDCVSWDRGLNSVSCGGRLDDVSWDGGSDCVSWDRESNSVSHSGGLDDVSGSDGWDALRVCLDHLQLCAVVMSTSVTFEGAEVRGWLQYEKNKYHV